MENTIPLINGIISDGMQFAGQVTLTSGTHTKGPDVQNPDCVHLILDKEKINNNEMQILLINRHNISWKSKKFNKLETEILL